MPCVSLQRMLPKFQEKSSDLETQLFELGFFCDTKGDTLESPTEEFIYNFNCFETDGIPIHVRTRRREIHGDAATRWQESVEYTDGLGRLALSKVQAEPGSNGLPRFVGTGRTIYNNAGNPIKQYEPYFSGTDAYESELAI